MADTYSLFSIRKNALTKFLELMVGDLSDISDIFSDSVPDSGSDSEYFVVRRRQKLSFTIRLYESDSFDDDNNNIQSLVGNTLVEIVNLLPHELLL